MLFKQWWKINLKTCRNMHTYLSSLKYHHLETQLKYYVTQTKRIPGLNLFLCVDYLQRGISNK